jgi:hypothetical protein
MEILSIFINQILPQIGKFLFWGIWFLIPVFLFLAFLSRRKLNWVTEQKHILLAIQVPKENEKGPIAAEMMFASLHGIFKPLKKRFLEGTLQEHISFEIASINQKIQFFVWVPENLQDFVEGQIYAQYPEVEIKQVSDYTNIDLGKEKQIIGTELLLNKEDFFPIKTFPDFEVDPLAGITEVLSKIEEGEQIWVQMLVRPTGEEWQGRALEYTEATRAGKTPFHFTLGSIMSSIGEFVGNLLSAITPNPSTSSEESTAEAPQLSPAQETQITAIEEKIAKLGFEAKIRIAYICKQEMVLKPRLQSIVGTFKQFSTANLNAFEGGEIYSGQDFLCDYEARLFTDSGFILNTEEMASIFHLPTVSVETPTISWTKSKKGEPPDNLPTLETVPSEELALFAETNFRNIRQKFGIKMGDRRHHMYLIGKTGTGKTTMLENMAIADIRTGKGVAVIDPHGDFIDKILNFIPTSRINDVIIFNPADREYPIAFNPLEAVDPDYKGLVASGLISIFQKIWAFTWGPRLEHILRNTLLALLDYPNSTMLGINRMLTDKKFRKKVIRKITDVEVKRFWTQEFPGYESNPRLVTEAISPIQNKVGQFVSSATIRNIIGQPSSTIDMRNVIDSGKILLIKLSQGTIGEDNSSLLGAMIITKLQLAAMSRVDISEEQRKDFYLFVDEFQNFATESFAKVLSEARKYRLNLTIANQYIAQMPNVVKDAVFGNIGTMVCFRVGAGDSEFLAKELAPVFNETDVINLDKYNIYIKLAIDGLTSPAFSAKTLPPPHGANKNRETIIHLSRERYSRSRGLVEEKIARWSALEEETREEPEKAQPEKIIQKRPQDTIRIEEYPEARVTPEEILEEITKEQGIKKEEEPWGQIQSEKKEQPKEETEEIPKSVPNKQKPILKPEASKSKTYELKEGEVVKIKNSH